MGASRARERVLDRLRAVGGGAPRAPLLISFALPAHVLRRPRAARIRHRRGRIFPGIRALSDVRGELFRSAGAHAAPAAAAGVRVHPLGGIPCRPFVRPEPGGRARGPDVYARRRTVRVARKRETVNGGGGSILYVVPSRAEDVRKAVAGYEATGVPLVAFDGTSYTPAGASNDVGMVYFIPKISTAFGLDAGFATEVFLLLVLLGGLISGA